MIRQATQTKLTAYATRGKAAAITAPAARQLAVFNARSGNRSGGSIDCGIMRLLAGGLPTVITGNANFRLYTMTTGGTVVTEKTAALLAAGLVVATTTNDDGFVVSSKVKQGLVGITVSNTATGGTFAFKYWTGAAWAALTTISAPADLSTVGDNFIAFLPPADWVAGGPTGVDSSMYSIFVQHTTAPGDTGAINALWVAEMIDFYEGVADNNVVQNIFDSDRPLILEAGEGLIPYFGTAHAGNYFGCFYSTV